MAFGILAFAVKLFSVQSEKYFHDYLKFNMTDACLVDGHTNRGTNRHNDKRTDTHTGVLTYFSSRGGSSSAGRHFFRGFLRIATKVRDHILIFPVR